MCRRFEGKPFTAAPLPDLPADHVCEEPPFTYPGIDFAGPLYINSPLTGQQKKAHCCLFTCASTCAIHLEVTESLTVASFLQAFRPFTSRRGLPSKLLTDTKTFKSAPVEVKKIVYSTEVHQYPTNKSNKNSLWSKPYGGVVFGRGW